MKANRTIILLLLAAVSLQSCATYGKFTEPVLDVQFSDSIKSLGWREMFRDTCLQKLIDTALVRNSDYGIALLRIEQAEQRLTEARLAYLPGASAAPGASWSGTSSVQPVYNLGLEASWELDLRGELTARKRLAQSSLEEMRLEGQAVRTRLICSIAQTYYSLLALDRKVEISEQTIVNWSKSVQVLEALKLAGRSNDIAVLQAKAKMLNLEASTEALKGQVLYTEQILCTLVGVTRRTIERGSILEQDFPTLENGIPLDYIGARPDVIASQKRLAQAFYATEIANAAFFPSLRLSGSAGWTNYSGGTVFDPMALVVNAATSLLQPVFSRGQIVVNHKIAKLDREAALLSYRQSILKAGDEVNNALGSFDTARQKTLLDRQQQETLSTAVEKITLLMRYSTASYLEVLTAQQSLLDSQLLLVQDELTVIQSRIELYAAVGGDYNA